MASLYKEKHGCVLIFLHSQSTSTNFPGLLAWVELPVFESKFISYDSSNQYGFISI